MYIVIEGCDAVGKTTLIEALQEKLRWNVLKGSSFEHAQCKDDKELFNKFDDLIDESLNSMKDTIFDRFIYSNEVYATLYKDYAILTDEQRRKIEYWINHCTAIIYLYADPDIIKSRLTSRGDDYVKTDMIEPILTEYNKSLMQVDKKIPIYSFDTGFYSTENMVDYIVNIIIPELVNK